MYVPLPSVPKNGEKKRVKEKQRAKGFRHGAGCSSLIWAYRNVVSSIDVTWVSPCPIASLKTQSIKQQKRDTTTTRTIKEPTSLSLPPRRARPPCLLVQDLSANICLCWISVMWGADGLQMRPDPVLFDDRFLAMKKKSDQDLLSRIQDDCSKSIIPKLPIVGQRPMVHLKNLASHKDRFVARLALILKVLLSHLHALGLQSFQSIRVGSHAIVCLWEWVASQARWENRVADISR